ncbi:MAG: hypothetical protein KC431_07510 [Myxococcales bacterium]|nr:hypothetical protein [Myxococcales bacterium]
MEQVDYKKPRKFNIIVILLLLALIGGAYFAWVYLPVSLRKSEAMRVLDEISSTFTGQASRMLADDKVVDKLRRDMVNELQGVGITDPDAEYWIEIDSDDQIRFGVLYSDYIELAWGEPKETVNEIEMICSRPGRGAGWTCESRDLTSEPEADEQPVDPGG